jgi:hypothetical protein
VLQVCGINSFESFETIKFCRNHGQVERGKACDLGSIALRAPSKSFIEVQISWGFELHYGHVEFCTLKAG